MTDRIGRRAFLSWTGRLGVALPLAALEKGEASASTMCVEIDSEPLRTSLNYADPSPYNDKRCSLCAFFEGTEDSANAKAACARCQIMTGPVSSSAYCDSFAPAAKKG
jgi:hypothetical protein